MNRRPQPEIANGATPRLTRRQCDGRTPARPRKQRQFLNQCAPPDVRIDRLVALGPIVSTKWTDVPLDGFNVNVEIWVTPELAFVELSLRVAPTDDEPPVEFESQVLAELRRLEAAVGD